MKATIFSYAVSERSHLLILAALAFLTGILSLFHLQAGAWLVLLAAIGAALALLLHRGGFACGAGVALCAFALGALWVNLAFHTQAPPPGSYEITASVVGEAQLRSDNRIRFVLADVALDGKAVEGKAYCSLHYEDAPPELFDGAAVRFQGRVYHPDGRSGPPHMDFRLWMRQKDLSYGIAAYQGISVENTPDTAPVMDIACRVRQRIRRIYDRLMGKNAEIAMAVLVGDKDHLSDEDYASFQKMGIAHVMTVSGLHVSLLGGLLLRALDHLQVKRRWSLAVLLAFLSGYCLLTGFSAAALRAASMLVFGVGSRMLRHCADRLTTLSAALLAVLILDPLQAFSAGFALSFCAVLGIVLYARPLTQLMDGVWKPVYRISGSVSSWLVSMLQLECKSVLAVTITAQMGILLPAMVCFHQLPTYGVLVNLLIVPFVSNLLLPLYALCLPLSLLPGVGLLAGRTASLLTDGLLALVRLLSELPYAALRTASPPMVLCIGAGLSLEMLSRRMPGTLRRRLCAACLALAVACCAAWMNRPASLRYIQLSAGQADSALLMDGDKTILIDTDVDGAAALDYLLDENRDVDALILTHLHVDHAGGVETLLNAGISIQRVYLPVLGERQKVDLSVLAALERLRAENVPVSELASGDELRYNKAVIRVLWPERDTVRANQNANDYPLVLSISLDGYTLLQTSDLSGAYERYAAVPADVLKVAHHGSYTSTSGAFLDFVSPQYALLSIASGSAHHPAVDTLGRLQSRGISVFRTDRDGDILLSVEKGRLLITPCRERKLP